MQQRELHILLADDDLDDSAFFEEAIIDLPVTFDKVSNGGELMGLLSSKTSQKPDIIFIDLNMPRKSGMECVVEIKSSDELSKIPLVIISTSLETTMVIDLYEIGVNYYIQKPSEFKNLKRMIGKAITLIGNDALQPNSIDQFIIEAK